MTKSDTRWKQSSDTKNEGEDIDTTSSGKDIRSRKHRGNQQRVLMAVAKKSLTSISAVTTSEVSTPTQATTHATIISFQYVAQNPPTHKENLIQPTGPKNLFRIQ